MFDEKTFIMNTLNSMLGNEPEYKVRQYAMKWYDNAVIALDDLQSIDTYYIQKAEEQIMTTEEPVIEDVPTVIPELEQGNVESVPMEEIQPAESVVEPTEQSAKKIKK